MIDKICSKVYMWLRITAGGGSDLRVILECLSRNADGRDVERERREG